MNVIGMIEQPSRSVLQIWLIDHITKLEVGSRIFTIVGGSGESSNSCLAGLQQAEAENNELQIIVRVFNPSSLSCWALVT